MKTDFYNPSIYDFRPACQLASDLRSVKIPSPIAITDVGPRFPTGPKFLGICTYKCSQYIYKYYKPGAYYLIFEKK